MTRYSHNKALPAVRFRPWPRKAFFSAGILLSALFLLPGLAADAYAHGGKPHADGGVAAFEALQIAMALYDRLLAHDKLDESWETGLQQVDISSTDPGGEGGFTVRFQRREGDPKAVYFFLSPTGEYAGSNFTGP